MVMPLNLMTNEEIYDAEIAPELLKLMKRCEELGFAFVANVEWEVGETGRTEFCPATDATGTRPSAKQLLVHYAARCHGNIDAMLMAVVKDAARYGHSSMYLKMLGCDNLVDTGGTCAFAITSPA